MKVLFIGNSYTYSNNLPRILQDLANSAGKTLNASMVSSADKTLEWHWYNPHTLDTIDHGPWDFIILQDHSLRPVEEPHKMHGAIKKLAGRIHKVQATPVLFITWARRHIPEMQEEITSAYLQAAREIEARIAPVGPAWQRALSAFPELPLHTEDRSHPNLLGSYLTACIFYATLFAESPVALTNQFRISEGVTAVIDADKAAFLQQTAWSTCREFQGNGK